jgi:sigma-B regulation protein RsbU (phosphoserine phosphatase)
MAQVLPLLIVEDNPVYAEILQRLLPTLGTGLTFETKWVDSAEKAVWELAQHRYELMLLDYKLPGADGLSVLSFVRGQPGAHQPAIIMLTGIGREDIAVQAMKQGAKDYLSKDHLDVPSLLRAITSALERKRAEDALAEERALLRALMESIPDYIFFKDTQSRYTRINPAQAQLLGLDSPEKAIGLTDADLLGPENVVERHAAEHELLSTGKPIVAQPERLRRPDGREVWLSVTKVPLRDRFETITGLAGISRDITERKELEDRLARTAEELRLRNTQMEADIVLAREIQEAFLPQSYPSFPANASLSESTLRFHHLYKPTIALGGDFFDVIPISDTQAGVFICDVMGHGIRAALITAILRALVEELRPVAGDPSKFLATINRSLGAILAQTRVTVFASAYYLVADVARREIRYANAGHPSPILVRGQTNTVELLTSGAAQPGPALGLFPDAEFPAASRPLATGDRVLLFTDGMYEVAGYNNEHYGEVRLLTAIHQRSRQPTADLINSLLVEVQSFAGTTEFSDDVCLVAVEAARLPA